MSSLRSSLYRLARMLGDGEAISKGPDAVVRRMGRRAAGRLFGRIMRKAIPPLKRRR